MISYLRKNPIRTSLVVAFLVTAPTVVLPFAADDYIHQLVLEAYFHPERSAHPTLDEARDPFGLLNIYRFLDGDPQRNETYRRNGSFPWWVHPEARVSFFRPMASMLAALDYALFGAHTALYRLHTLAWWLVLVAGFGLILRRAAAGSSLLPLAILLYAITDKHFLPVSWIANRHAMLSVAAGAFGLLAYMRWREDGWRVGAWLAPLGLGAGLAGGETGVGMFGFLVAYEVLGAPKRRPICLLPSLLIAAAWAATYKTLGYGTYGSGLYIDPVGEPLRYLVAVVTHGPALILGEFGGIPSDLWFLRTSFHLPLIILGLITIVVVGAVLRHAWPALQQNEQRATRWLLVGALLALAPSLAASPGDRLLLLPGLGFCWVMAILLRHCWRLRSERRLLAIYGGALGLRHLLLPPLAWLLATGGTWNHSRATQQMLEEAELPTEGIEDLRVVVVHASDPSISMYMPIRMMFQDRPMPRQWFVWSNAPADHVLSRPTATRLELTCLSGGMLDAPFARLFRGPQYPLVQGEIVELDGYQIEILEAEGPRLIRIGIELDVDPEDSDLRFLSWRDGAVRKLMLPPVGGSVSLPFTPGPLGL